MGIDSESGGIGGVEANKARIPQSELLATPTGAILEKSLKIPRHDSERLSLAVTSTTVLDLRLLFWRVWLPNSTSFDPFSSDVLAQISVVGAAKAELVIVCSVILTSVTQAAKAIK
jgi:hypothetical protein